MGRPLKTVLFNDWQREFIAAVSMRHTDPMPRSPRLLRRALESIIAGIEASNSHKGRSLRARLQIVAGLEELQHRDVTTFEDLYIDSLGKTYSRTGGAHAPETISLHNQIAIEYSSDCHFPDRARNLDTQHEWIKKHGPRLLEELGMLPCFCTYQTKIAQSEWLKFTSHLERKSRITLTKRELILILLAHLHESEPEEIRKLLAESTWP